MKSGDFSDWIGRSVTRHDVVTERLVDQFRSTLAPHLFDAECPPGLHWCLAVPAHPPENLGPDGAERRGLFIPPIELPRRMWAGGAIETFGSFRIGDSVKRVSRLVDVKWREGRNGALCILAVEHELSARGAIIVRERQDLLFRDGRTGPTAPAQDFKGDLVWHVDASPLLLFRFSALTFNGHRIHYDLPYAREVEGYDGLLVHGPLQATLMLNQLSVAMGHVPQQFDYRCVAPLTHGQVFSLSSGGGRGFIRDAAGVVTLEARAQ